MTDSTNPSDPGVVIPLAPSGPGTDFILFATGGGANIEDMASYQADPQRGTGNLPGIARSNFNNRVMRQGAFVAAGVSTFIWQVLSIYVPDDGDLDNWVANFKAALQAYITPGGTLPGGPYLPLAGGTMSGNINFQTGATIVLANNTYLRALDSGGTAHGLERLGTDGNQYIGDGSASLIVFGSTPTVGSGLYWSARDTGGTVHGLLGIQSDNNTYLQGYNNLYINASTIWVNCNFVIPNNNWYYGKNAAGAPVTLLGVRSDNYTLIAQGAPGETWIYAASGARIVLNNAVTVVGTLSPSGNVNIGGSLNVANTTVLSSSLQVNGATNLYARLNVNNSVGATITGDVLTNSLHVTGGSSLDNGANINGTTNIQYLQVHNPGGNDPMSLYSDNGYYARIRYTVLGTRAFTAGLDYLGRFVLADESAGRYDFYCNTDGVCYATVGLSTPQIWTNGNISCGGQLYIAGLSGLYDGGGNWMTTGANFHSGGWMQVDGNFQCNNTITGYNFQSNGNINCNNQTSSNTVIANYIHSNGDLTANGNFNIAGGQATVQHLSANNGMCIGGAAINFDYTFGFPIGNHSQWAGGIGCYAAFFTPYSDERYKENVSEVERDALAAILPVRLYQYDRPRVTAQGEVRDNRSHVATGVLAQQIQKSLPDAVVETEELVKFNELHAETGEVMCGWETRPSLGVDLMTLCAYQMRAIQQLHERIAALEAGRA